MPHPTQTNAAPDLAKEGAERIRAALDAGELVTLGTINQLFAPLRVDEAGLALLGFGPIARLKAARLYRTADVVHMRAALILLLIRSNPDDQDTALATSFLALCTRHRPEIAALMRPWQDLLAPPPTLQ